MKETQEVSLLSIVVNDVDTDEELTLVVTLEELIGLMMKQHRACTTTPTVDQSATAQSGILLPTSWSTTGTVSEINSALADLTFTLSATSR